MKIKYQDLQKKINVKFKNLDLLTQSLTHKSFNANKNNEKLEFLGDRVLGLVISKKLLEKYPHDREGSLDKKLASLVNKRKCLEVAKSINLDKFFGDQSGINLPMYVGYSRNVIKPLYDPLSPDLLFEKSPNEAENLWNDRFYNGIDLLLLTSHSESFPNVIAESMYGMCANEGKTILLFDAIIDHRMNENALSFNDQYFHDKRGKQQRK